MKIIEGPVKCETCGSPVNKIEYQGKRTTTHLLAKDTKYCRILKKIGEALN